MRICLCGEKIPYAKVIDGKRRSLTNRSKCLKCLPFGSSIYSRRYEPSQRKKKALERGRKKQSTWRARRMFETGIDPILQFRKKRKLEAITALGGSCVLCRYGKCQRNLVFHHVRDKSFGLSERSFQSSWKKLIPELRKCVLVCHNCHGEIHEGAVDSAAVKQAHEAAEAALTAWTPL